MPKPKKNHKWRDAGPPGIANINVGAKWEIPNDPTDGPYQPKPMFPDSLGISGQSKAPVSEG